MIGNQIKQIRKARGKSQATLAAEVNISKTFMSLIETGRNPSLGLLYKICDNLNAELRIIPKL